MGRNACRGKALNFRNDGIQPAHGKDAVRRGRGRLHIQRRSGAAQAFVSADEKADARRIHELHARKIEHDPVARQMRFDGGVHLSPDEPRAVFVKVAAEEYVERVLRNFCDCVHN